MSDIITEQNLPILCDRLAARDPDLAQIITKHGYPPLWSRPNTFESLTHIVLEQQVSLASALVTLEKLRSQLGAITPELILTLNDDEMKACYVSRQKAGYIRGLAAALTNHTIDLIKFETLDSATVRRQLTSLKGIGDWTADIYEIFVLHQPDIFPFGDLAARKAIGTIKGQTATTADQLMTITEQWRPYRTAATMLLWHYYLSKPKSA